MTYDSQKNKFDKEHFYIVELELDSCPLDHGSNPCTATETGDDKCFNTFETCNDLPNYKPTRTSEGYSIRFVCVGPLDFSYYELQSGSGVTWQDLGFLDDTNTNYRVKGVGFANPIANLERGVSIGGTATKLYTYCAEPAFTTSYSIDHIITQTTGRTYRFCEPRSPHPIAVHPHTFDAIPSLKSVSLTPSKIDVAGGLGERSSVSLVFNDHTHNDVGHKIFGDGTDIDRYISDRTYIATDRGTFWTKLRARNPNYQFRALRILTGYLKNGEYEPSNFKTRNYIIEKMDVGGGTCRITAKDPLKKASSKKAQVPKPNSGTINDSGGINATATSLTLTPTGVGDDEYETSGYVALGGSEIASFTRISDTLTLVRAQYNTTAKEHDQYTVVQQCYQKQAEVNVIARDVLVNFADFDPDFINDTAWQAEVDTTSLNGNLDGIIPKPTDVEKVLKELAEAKPHFIYWDELNQQARFTALKEPPEDANEFDMDSNLIKGSVNFRDLPEMRASTIYFTFGQIDPTKSLTDFSNFTQTIVRTDTDSVLKYGSNQIKNITSRWIPSTNLAIAEDAAQVLGRRLSNIPREVSFSVDVKDNDLNLGDTKKISHRDTVDATGSPLGVIYQIISKQESGNFNYKGVEYTFGAVMPADNLLTDDTIYISINEQNLNLYDRYVALIGSAPTASTDAVYKVRAGVVVGSATTGGYAVDTGTGWPSGATITLINEGHIVGAGGAGGSQADRDGQSGGDAMNLQFDLALNNLNIIGGGGGGAPYLNGGGGAGNTGGVSAAGSDGGLEIGGDGGGGFPSLKGGDLGESGPDDAPNSRYGGAAGAAINKNGNTLTYTYEGDIRGSVS